MAGWRDNLRPASFRGVPFHVEGHNAQGGRRGQTHEFGGRDDPYREDLGRMARTWRIRAYVIGDDYFAKRNALQDALEKAGPGVLVHPWLGTIPAASATDYDLSEEKDKGGEAIFSITFVEAGENSFPAAAADRRQAVGTAAAATGTAAGTSFTNRFTVASKPAFVFQKSRDLVGGFLGDLRAQAASVRGEVTPAWSVIRQIDGSIGSAGALVRSPLDLVGDVRGAVEGFAGLLPSGQSALGPLLRLAGWSGSTGGGAYSAPATPSRAQVATNEEAFTSLVRRVSVAEAAVKLTEPAPDGGAAFASLDDALAARDAVVASIDAEIDAAGARGEHDDFVAMSSLRTETVRFANEEAARLPRLRAFTPGATVPAALIAYRLYDDATRADEAAARNRIRHPGFVPGGTTLQVLDA